MLKKYKELLSQIDPIKYTGRVSRITGLAVESIGPAAQIGDVCRIVAEGSMTTISAEVVGFKDEKVLLMPFSDLSGVGLGSVVESTNRPLTVPVGMGMRGRILDGLANPMDNKGPIQAESYYPVNNLPVNPLKRSRICQPLSFGIRAIDGMLTCGRGQRLGIFAGSGVGKSTLLGMIARNTHADVNVVVLVGERGREVRDFIERDLQEEGLARSVVVVATSEQPALVRLKSAMIGTAIAEYFRDQGLHVMLLMDSLTRFAMAQREIGLALGEPPVARGYTPSVLALLPKLLERAGTSDTGSITGLYTVLVDGDDMNEPITDIARGILDGHIILSRNLANRGHYPAIDVLASISRVMPEIISKEHMAISNDIRNALAMYRETEDLIHIGAYRKGSDPRIDRAVSLIQPINGFLQQKTDELSSFDETIEEMNRIVRQCEAE
ncbi:MAG: flagellar protein export ATPase FliI [Firmicutes bacterium]|nr:flagellar protein export ATPase FliI [Bacillota bacterium]